MGNVSFHRITGFMVALLSLCLSVSAMAQYVWVDGNNVRHYSDMQPPTSIPDSRILKTPSGTNKSSVRYEAVTKESDTSVKKETTSSAPSMHTPLTLAEKNAEFQKRKMEQIENDKKAEEEEKRVANKKENCDRARGYQKSLETSQRIATMDKNGERIVLNDEQRARELQEVNRALEKCK